MAEWRDKARILSVRPFNERDHIVCLFTANHGRHKALLPASSRKERKATLLVGNSVQADWTARLDSQLGYYRLELLDATAPRLIEKPLRLLALTATAEVIEACLPEREPEPRLFDAYESFLENLGGSHWAELLVHFEKGLLGALGYGLDLSRCAASGQTDDLIYVSPKSGRAVSREAGEPYKSKLLPLPAFLLTNQPAVTPKNILQGLELTGFFLTRFLEDSAHRPLPEARQRLVMSLSQQKEGPEQ